MLVLARSVNEGITARFDEQTLETLLQQARTAKQPILFRFGPVEIQGGKVRLGIHAPKQIPVDRDEVYVRAYEDIPPFSGLRDRN
jgi:sRNA-binding carbon storage regulator CsrA